MSEKLLNLEGVSKTFPGGFVALDTIDLAIGQGEFLSLLGPSGCGKTTTLRVISGFEAPSAGRVILDGRDITPLRPYDRPVNTVFQDYALFPHMSVRDNIAFGLSLRKIPSAQRDKKVKSALEMVGMPEKADARIGALSGGQRQRIALARAIVCEPRLLLLDEPLSALDAHLREHMQMELKSLQARLGTTFVMVTHDQTEALSISDRIVVMNLGRIEQTASPAELYDHPATRFVASFIGTMNLLPARITAMSDHGATVDVSGWALDVSLNGKPIDEVKGQVTIGIRPEDIVITDASQTGSLVGKATAIVFHGKSLRLRAEIGPDMSLSVDIPRQSDQAKIKPGDIIHMVLRPGATCHMLAG